MNLLKAGDLEVRASFSLSYQGLSPTLQQAFRLTGALPLEFPAWALAAVTDHDVDNAEELLEQLADAQLVDISGVDASGLLRYTLHDLLRDFARERLAETDTPEARQAALAGLLEEYIAMAALGAQILQPGAHTQTATNLNAVGRDHPEKPAAPMVQRRTGQPASARCTANSANSTVPSPC